MKVSDRDPFDPRRPDLIDPRTAETIYRAYGHFFDSLTGFGQALGAMLSAPGSPNQGGVMYGFALLSVPLTLAPIYLFFRPSSVKGRIGWAGIQLIVLRAAWCLGASIRIGSATST